MEYNLIHKEEVDSTNRYAYHLISSNEAHQGDVIVADYQTSGVGQGDNFWESESGKNLLMSIIVEPTFLPASKQFILTEIISLSLVHAIRSHLKGYEVKIKWPNDIYVNDSKIGGVLIQNFIFGNKLSFSIIGIGINVNQNIFRLDAPNPVSMSILSNIDHSVIKVRDSVLQEFSGYYNEDIVLQKEKKLKDQYLYNLYRIGMLTEFEDSTGRFLGKITSVDEFGRLMITRSDGTKSFLLAKRSKNGDLRTTILTYCAR